MSNRGHMHACSHDNAITYQVMKDELRQRMVEADTFISIAQLKHIPSKKFNGLAITFLDMMGDFQEKIDEVNCILSAVRQ